MKFFEILKTAFNNPDCQFKLNGQDMWSQLNVISGSKENCNFDHNTQPGFYFLNNDGFQWWPDEKQIKSDNWEVKGFNKTRNLFVVYDILDENGCSYTCNHILTINICRTLTNRDDLEYITNFLCNETKEKNNKQVKPKNLIITFYKWME